MKIRILPIAATLMLLCGFASRADALDMKRMTLSNGAVLMVSEQRLLPMVTIEIAFDAGSRRDPQGKEGLAELTARYDAAQRAANIKNAKEFGVADPGAIIDAYAAARKKWSGLSKAVGRDIDKFTDAIWREIYSKVDPDKL